MNAATKKLTEEIDGLLSLSVSFNEKYKQAPASNIGEELYDDLLYFHTRAMAIFEALNKADGVGILKGLKFRHMNIHKSSIDTPEEDFFKLRALLKVTKRELDEGLLYKVSELIKAEVFSNFMEYARVLLDGNYKDAAAVMIGGVLEDKLRTECDKRGLPTKDAKGKNLTIDPMNISLKGAGVYDLLKQKQITVYADIRNNAAHANYDKYQKDDVEEMYKYVLGFTI